MLSLRPLCLRSYGVARGDSKTLGDVSAATLADMMTVIQRLLTVTTP